MEPLDILLNLGHMSLPLLVTPQPVPLAFSFLTSGWYLCTPEGEFQLPWGKGVDVTVAPSDV